MARSYVQTPFGKESILIADDSQFSSAHWSDIIRNKTVEKARRQLPNCLRPYGKKEFFLAITAKLCQTFGNKNK